MAQGKERKEQRRKGAVLLVTDQAVDRRTLACAAEFGRALGATMEHWMIVETVDEMARLIPKLERGAASLQEVVPGAEAELKKGLAAEILSDLVPEAYSLVVLCFSGRRGLKKVFPRAEVLAILRNAKVNVLVLWGRDRVPGRALFLVGGSPYAQQAVEFGAPLVAALGAEATVLHVAEPEPKLFVPEREVQMEEGVRKALEKAVETLEKAGVPVEEKVRHGKVADQVLAEAAAGEYDLVVVGSHGMGGIRHLILGHVAEALVRRARVPLLIVRARERKPFWRRLFGLAD